MTVGDGTRLSLTRDAAWTVYAALEDFVEDSLNREDDLREQAKRWPDVTPEADHWGREATTARLVLQRLRGLLNA